MRVQAKSSNVCASVPGSIFSQVLNSAVDLSGSSSCRLFHLKKKVPIVALRFSLQSHSSRLSALRWVLGLCGDLYSMRIHMVTMSPLRCASRRVAKKTRSG